MTVELKERSLKVDKLAAKFATMTLKNKPAGEEDGAEPKSQAYYVIKVGTRMVVLGGVCWVGLAGCSGARGTKGAALRCVRSRLELTDLHRCRQSADNHLLNTLVTLAPGVSCCGIPTGLHSQPPSTTALTTPPAATSTSRLPRSVRSCSGRVTSWT